MIRPAIPADAAAIAAIYNHYVRETVVTFEEEPIGKAEMSRRITEVTAGHPWLVAVEGGKVLGYAYANHWKARSAYRFSTESTVYLGPDATGRGLGTGLYTALLAELRRHGCHCVIGGIALPNPASVGLHEKLGFKKVGHMQEAGWKFEAWWDVGFWERML